LVSGALRKLAIIAAGVAMAALLAVAFFYLHLMNWADQPLRDETALDDGAIVQLQSGQSLASLAAQMQNQGLINARRRLLLLGRVSGLDTQLQAGEYRIDAQLTPRQLLQKLNRGDVVTYEFRIEEGGTVAQMLRDLADHEPLERTLQAVDAAALQAELGLS
jgi:UPF0755 protein